MIALKKELQSIVAEAVSKLYKTEFTTAEFQETRKEFEGDFTLVVFPLVKFSKLNPEQTATQIGEYLLENHKLIHAFQVVKGFLNLTITPSFWLEKLGKIADDTNFGIAPTRTDLPAVMVEYSSPNTNKPLHLGHVRNNLLGYALAQIFKATGREVIMAQIINDRGIHICKSMLAWQLFGNGETPETNNTKGDHLVGKYYVAFDKAYKAEIATLVENGKTAEEAAKEASIMLQAQEMLRKWEAGDHETIALWQKMNTWVYVGFNQTYKTLGVHFDKNYYESQTYLLGKADVDKGLAQGIFFKKPDGSVWIDLTAEGLDEKLVLRSDGTSVYMTQDIGTATKRFEDFNINSLTYVVGNEQDYHFKVLFLILEKLGYSWAKNLYHLSYGMVDLPTGKMKSREGTVVDADDLVAEMIETAHQTSEDLGKLDGLNEETKKQLNTMIGLGALKYFILKVDPRKRMVFNPAESIDFNGNTGPFIQYTFARIQSLQRKAGEMPQVNLANYPALPTELALIRQMAQFPEIIATAAHDYSPANIANYVYDLVKNFNTYYQQNTILGSVDVQTNAFRLLLSTQLAAIIKRGMGLLGIDCPDRM